MIPTSGPRNAGRKSGTDVRCAHESLRTVIRIIASRYQRHSDPDALDCFALLAMAGK